MSEQRKTLQQREKELQSLLATGAGRAELAQRYGAATGRVRPARTSAVTFIQVHERQQGLIDR